MNHRIGLPVVLLLAMVARAQASTTTADVVMEKGFTIWGVCHKMAVSDQLPEAMTTSECIKTVRGQYPKINPRKIREGRVLRFPQAQSAKMPNIQAPIAVLPAPPSPSMNGQESIGPELGSIRAQVADTQKQVGQLLVEVRNLNVLLKTEQEAHVDFAKNIQAITSKLEKQYVSRQDPSEWLFIGLAAIVVVAIIAFIAGGIVYARNQKEEPPWVRVRDKLTRADGQAADLIRSKAGEEFLFDIKELYGGEFSTITLALKSVPDPRCYFPCGSQATATNGNVAKHLQGCPRCEEAIRAEVATEAA